VFSRTYTRPCLAAGRFFTDFTPIFFDDAFNVTASTRRIAVVMSAIETTAYRRNTLAVLCPLIPMHQFSGLPAATMLRIADR